MPNLRKNLHEAISNSRADSAHAESEGAVVLTGWVLMTEWIDENGHRWLERVTAQNVTAWQRDGMLHQGLHRNWK